MKIHEAKINKLHAASALTSDFSFSLPRICYMFYYREPILPYNQEKSKELTASYNSKSLSLISFAVLTAH